MMQLLDNLLEQVRGVWRFRWIGVAVAWVVLPVALVVIILLPDRYEASATVFVDTQTALSAATRNLTVDEGVDSQIQRVRQALLGGPQLAKIADDTGLTARALTPQERQRVIEDLRRQIQISAEVLRDAPGAGTYVVSYTHNNRETSLKVVDRFVNTFVEEAMGGKREGSEKAQQFLSQQIAELEKRLRDSEDALAEFKKQHVGLLPSDQNDFFNRLDTELAELDTAQTKLSLAVTRRNELQRQLRGEQPLVAGGADRVSAMGAPGGTGSDTATRLQQSQQRLDELLLSFTEKHPKVIELRNNVKELERRLTEEIDAAKRGDATAAARTGLTASPVYQSLQLQYNQVGVEIAGLQADTANRRQRVATLRSMMSTAPEVEAQFSRLNRDYKVVRAQYDSLVEQLGRTRLGEQAAQTGVIRFDLVDPPRSSFDPVFPKRALLAVVALVAAVVMGGGVAFLLNLLRPVFSSARRLSEITGLPVLGVVSMTHVERYDAQHRRSALQVAGALVGMVVLCAVFLLTQRHIANALKTWMT